MKQFSFACSDFVFIFFVPQVKDEMSNISFGYKVNFVTAKERKSEVFIAFINTLTVKGTLGDFKKCLEILVKILNINIK